MYFFLQSQMWELGSAPEPPWPVTRHQIALGTCRGKCLGIRRRRRGPWTLREASRFACSISESMEIWWKTNENYGFPLIFHWFLWFSLVFGDFHDFHWSLLIFSAYCGRPCGSRSIRGPRRRRLMPKHLPQHVPSAIWCRGPGQGGSGALPSSQIRSAKKVHLFFWNLWVKKSYI